MWMITRKMDLETDSVDSVNRFNESISASFYYCFPIFSISSYIKDGCEKTKLAYKDYPGAFLTWKKPVNHAS